MIKAGSIETHGGMAGIATLVADVDMLAAHTDGDLSVVTTLTTAADSGVVDLGHVRPIRRVMTAATRWCGFDVSTGAAGGPYASARTVALNALTWRAFKQAANVTAFAVRLLVGAGQRKPGVHMIEVGPTLSHGARFDGHEIQGEYHNRKKKDREASRHWYAHRAVHKFPTPKPLAGFPLSWRFQINIVGRSGAG